MKMKIPSKVVILKAKRRISANRDNKEQDRLRTNMERMLVPRLTKIFKTYVKEYAEGFADGNEKPAHKRFVRRLEATMFPFYSFVITTFAKRTIERYKPTIKNNEETEIRGLIQTYLSLFGAALVVKVSDTMRNDIQDVVINGLANGGTIDTIADDILKLNVPILDSDRKFTKDPQRFRAMRIARTECGGAAGWASNESVKTLNIPDLKKMWVATTGSNRTRSTHLAANRQEVGMNEKFLVGSAYLEYPGDQSANAPGETINCRCSHLFVDDDTKIY